MVTIVIGKNFGDEGKGLAVDHAALHSLNAGHTAACVRHNGGAQAGHTVDLHGRRFVFSQLSSASFRGADTYWADSFLPDLYKLSSELDSFRTAGGTIPRIFASASCRCTYIGDILLNMLLETARGKNRHGSCGMGINEAVQRSETHPLYLRDVKNTDAAGLYHMLKRLQTEYLPQRIADLHIDLQNAGEYGDLLRDDNVLRNAAEQMQRNAENVQLRETDFLRTYEDMIFEGAQGLLLDEYYLQYAPHLTTSRTGLHEPARILHEIFGTDRMPQIEVRYITRSYVTRHGAGPLPYEDSAAAYAQNDRTNVPNEWQGSLRAAPHGSTAEFAEAVLADLAENPLSASISLFVTHLNESGGCIMTKDGRIPAEEYCTAAPLHGLFGTLYCSETPYAEDVRQISL